MSATLWRMASEIVDGFWRGLNVMLWGWPYPKKLDAADLIDPEEWR